MIATNDTFATAGVREPLLVAQTTKFPWSLFHIKTADSYHVRSAKSQFVVAKRSLLSQPTHPHSSDINDMEEGYASSTSSLSDDFIDEQMDRIANRNSERLDEDLVQLWQQHHDNSLEYWFSERGRMLMEAFLVLEKKEEEDGAMLSDDDYQEMLVTQQQQQQRQRQIEVREQNQATIVSCTILVGVTLVFAWVYVFGLTNEDA